MTGHNRFQHTCSFQLFLSFSDDPESGWRRAGQIADLISPADLVMLHSPPPGPPPPNWPRLSQGEGEIKQLVVAGPRIPGPGGW